MNSNTPTPETDAAEQIRAGSFVGSQSRIVTSDFARKLERERSQLLEENAQLKINLAEVRRQHQQEASDWKTDEEVTAERDQLRKVCDELAAELKLWWEPIPEGHFHPDNPVGQICRPLESYNQLPHVKREA